jgi:hypothetical protein
MTARFKVKQIIRILLWTLSIVIVVGYGASRAYLFVKGPSISINSPTQGAVVSESFIEINGTAENISFITLNGARIYLDESGKWQERTLLSYGYNILTAEAVDRFGRKVSKKIEVVYK